MNKIIEKNYSLIFLIFLYIQPFLDVITSIMINQFSVNLTIGIIVRCLFILYIIYTGIFVHKIELKKKLIYLVLISTYSLIYTFNNILQKDISILFFEISNLIKILFLPVCLIFSGNINIKKSHFLILFSIYALFVIVPTIFNVNFDSYAYSKVGSIGWFNSANEVNAIISILLPFVLVSCIKKENRLYLIGLFSIFIMGTKTSLIALIICIVIYGLYYIYKHKNNTKMLKVILAISIISFMLFIYIFPKTSISKNIIMHLEFLEIDNISQVFSYKSLNRFILSDRLDFLMDTNDHFYDSSITSKIFGIGYTKSNEVGYVEDKLIEMDVYDIYYRLGIMGFLLVIVPLIAYIFNDKFKIFSEYTLSIFLGLLISLIAGHVLVAPGVSIYLIVMLKNDRKEDDLIGNCNNCC